MRVRNKPLWQNFRVFPKIYPNTPNPRLYKSINKLKEISQNQNSEIYAAQSTYDLKVSPCQTAPSTIPSSGFLLPASSSGCQFTPLCPHHSLCSLCLDRLSPSSKTQLQCHFLQEALPASTTPINALAKIRAVSCTKHYREINHGDNTLVIQNQNA